MGKISLNRVLLGGLAAAVVLNIGEYVLNGILLAKAMEEDFRRLNLAPPGDSFMMTAVGMTVILGIGLVFLYAAIRPRFGAGPKTALCAGAMAWFFVYLYAGFFNAALGITSTNPYLIALVWGLVEYCAAAAAGAWLYKESSE